MKHTMTSSIIIGAGYGDEGKGLITDFEVRRLEANTVARFNGGSQAGHTVVTRDGRRHVFGHIGAGTFAGADTYLSSKFIVNPFTLIKEFGSVSLGRDYPRIRVHPDARVTTLFDMALNALVELKRGSSRNGSCGLGINETVTRHETFPLTASEIKSADRSYIVHKLQNIRDNWVMKRLETLDVIHHAFSSIKPTAEDIPEPYKSILFNADLESMAAQMQEGAKLLSISTIDENATYIFEGAQGLMLDEFLGDYPHVTRSITGMPFALVAANEVGVKNVAPIYVTRAYQTRHGAGPLTGVNVETGCNIVDTTNVDNEWQGSLRFAPLDLKSLEYFIKQDIARGSGVAQIFGINVAQATLAITCLDQCGDKVTVIALNGSLQYIKKENLIEYISNAIGLPVSHTSIGPTANDVVYKYSHIRK
jgi:adenylosuccinate synthase